ncbi:MAG: hypothetical protein HZA20_03755 [Nitrospirae bacterium]|nr:hypothetical protein [Nitrospirota bacterium]
MSETDDLPPYSSAMITDMTLEEQNRRSFELFQQLDANREKFTAQEMIGERIRINKQIIKEYPQAGLAPEAHVKLIKIYLNELNPSSPAKAESVYHRLAASYADSKSTVMDAQNELVKHYARNLMWSKILSFTGPVVRANVNAPPPLTIFYYGEANFQLGRKDEAVLAFKLAMRTIPSNSYLHTQAKERLVKMGALPPEAKPVTPPASQPAAAPAASIPKGTVQPASSEPPLTVTIKGAAPQQQIDKPKDNNGRRTNAPARPAGQQQQQQPRPAPPAQQPNTVIPATPPVPLPYSQGDTLSETTPRR